MNEPVSNLLGQIRITYKSEQIAYQSLINKLIVWGKSWCHSDPLERACRGQPCVYGDRCQNKQHALMLMRKQDVMHYPGHGTALHASRKALGKCSSSSQFRWWPLSLPRELRYGVHLKGSQVIYTGQKGCSDPGTAPKKIQSCWGFRL